LKDEIRVTAFLRKGTPAYDEIKNLFGLYEYESRNLAVELIDPDLTPSLANEAEIRRYGIPVAFFDGKTGRETITTFDEEQITNALIKVSRGESKNVYFLTGHGEPSLDDTGENGLSIVNKLLEDKNYKPEELLLMRAEKVPDDCKVLVVAGPQTDIIQPELAAIEQHIKEGGRSLFLVDPEAAPALKGFLENYGLVLGDDIVIDRMSRLFGGNDLTPVLTTYSSVHPITKNFNVASFFVVARSVSTQEKPGVRTSWLAKTGEGSWAESDLDALRQGSASFDAGKDSPGPVTLAAAVELDQPEQPGEESDDSEKGALVVFGDSDFVTNARVNLSGNSDLFMNAVNWLAKEETLIAIRPKETAFSPVILTPTDAKLLFLLPVIVLPGAILLAGIYVSVRRNRHP